MGDPFIPLVLDSSLAAHHALCPGGVKLGLTLIGVQTVLLLLHIRQLGVAQAKHLIVVQQRVGQTLVAGLEILVVLGILAVAPAANTVGVQTLLGCLADAAGKRTIAYSAAFVPFPPL